MKTTWIVRWRGSEEECVSPQLAFDRWDQLDALGIEADLAEVHPDRRRRLVRTGNVLAFGGGGGDAVAESAPAGAARFSL